VAASQRTRARNPIGRAFEILSWLSAADGKPAGPREIARELGMTPSTVHRLLAQLEDEGLVRSLPEGRYELGLEFLRLAWLASGAGSLRELALPHLRALAAAAGETAILASYDPARLEACVVATVESDQPVRFVPGLHERRPLAAGALGRAILAFLPDRDRAEVVARGLPPIAPATITDPAALELALEETRAKGYARSVEERRPGAVGLAAPVVAPGRRVVASVGLALPTQRFDLQDEARLASLVVRCAGSVSSEIGGP
jgi:IclR family acetate operon transcriptional repressor